MVETVERRKRVCVIGAGAAGLPSVRHSMLYGFETICYEGSGGIGGLWRFKPTETDESSVMKSTVSNSSKEMSAYSDFPPKAELPNFLHNQRVHQYYTDYAEHFGLNDCIKFFHKVQNVVRADDYATTGRWNVTVTDTRSRTTYTEIFDGVLLCTGHHTHPYVPEPWPGQKEFKGKIIHSHSYKDHIGYEDKNVVVVGIGNSGGDIATELSKISKQALYPGLRIVYLVSRTGAWVFNRIYEYGRPIDCSLNTRFIDLLRKLWCANAVVRWQLNRRFDHELYHLKPNHDVFGGHLTINDELPNRIASGTVRVKPQIAQFTGTRGMDFEDGTSVENIDAVILSTGYSISFPMIEKGKLVEVEDNKVDLYQFIFPLACEHDTLGIIGLIQPFGSAAPVSEMQARVFLDVLAGRSKLPSKERRLEHLKQRREEMEARFSHSRRHTIQVDYFPYMDELASLIGCLPPYWFSYLPFDPLMAAHSFFAPFAPYFYRIKGPHAWPEARETILSIEDRIAKGTNSNMAGTLFTYKHVGATEVLVGVLTFIGAAILFGGLFLFYYFCL